MHRLSARPITMFVAFVVLFSMTTFVSGAASTATSMQAAATAPTVAHNHQGSMTARVVGETATGKQVTGKFYPMHFSTSDGKIRVRGLINGVVHNADGSSSTFSAMRTLRVKTINAVPIRLARTTARELAACDILRLVLGPLDLDLLGLQVHLDRIVLTVIAQSGAGNLLGNLLCAVAGLLDNGLNGLLGRITNLLNQILAILRLGG